jgi:hypothetical protein
MTIMTIMFKAPLGFLLFLMAMYVPDEMGVVSFLVLLLCIFWELGRIEDKSDDDEKHRELKHEVKNLTMEVDRLRNQIDSHFRQHR